MATIALDVKINALESAKTLKELKTGMKDLNNELAGLEQGSEEFNRVASAVGNAKDKLASMNDELVQTTTKAGKFQSITAIASQLAAGFGAAGAPAPGKPNTAQCPAAPTRCPPSFRQSAQSLPGRASCPMPARPAGWKWCRRR